MNQIIIMQSGKTLPHSRDLAEALASLAIAAAKLGVNHEPVSLPAAPAASLPNRQNLPRNGFRRRSVHRHDVADVDKNCNQVNQ